MGHDHHHSHDDHADDHAPEHFERCDHRDTCFCEVKRYLFASTFGFFFALWQRYIAIKEAGSYGATGDANHMLADNSFILVSAGIALWKHYDKKRQRLADRIGTFLQSSFLITAGVVVAVRTVEGGFTTFSSGWMFVASLVGIIGSLAQFTALGKTASLAISQHSATLQHVVYDMAFSVIAMAASIATMFGHQRAIDVGVAYTLSGAMILTGCWNLWKLWLGRAHAH